MKIGICGGTFDPIHRGHLDPILAVRADLEWDRVLYVPAFVQPFKTDRTTVSAYHRFAMVALATEEHESFYVTPRELERGAISYTVDTLQQLRSEHPDATLDWVIGDDNLEQLLEWKSIDTILALANFAVLTRGGHRDRLPASLAPRIRDTRSRPASGAIVFAHNDVVAVSSTEVRRRVRAGEPIEELVGPRVSRYIHHYELYRKGQS